jgi:hypothetical protein
MCVRELDESGDKSIIIDLNIYYTDLGGRKRPRRSGRILGSFDAPKIVGL